MSGRFLTVTILCLAPSLVACAPDRVHRPAQAHAHAPLTLRLALAE